MEIRGKCSWRFIKVNPLNSTKENSKVGKPARDLICLVLFKSDLSFLCPSKTLERSFEM